MYVYTFNVLNRRIGVIYLQKKIHLYEKNIIRPIFGHLSVLKMMKIFRKSKNNIKNSTK